MMSAPRAETREIVPPEMLPEVRRAEIVITNYHAFQHRETLALPKVARSFLQLSTSCTLERRQHLKQARQVSRQGPSLLFPGVGPADVLPGWACLQRWPQIHANESATRLIAGCFRFFTLIQFGDRPARIWSASLTRRYR